MYNDKGESYRYEEPKNSWSEPAVFEIIPVNGNTSKYKSLLAQYSIAGKSGTAQIARSDGPGYYTDQVNTTYVGFDASPDSKFVMLIKLHKPKDADFSASNVFPLWVETFIELKDLLGVEKNK